MLTKSMCWDASAVIILARLGLLGLLKLQIVTRHFWHFLSLFPVVCITCITWTTPLSNHAKFSKKSQRSMMIHVMLRLQKGRPPSSCHCWDCNWRPACHRESQTHSGSHPSVHEKTMTHKNDLHVPSMFLALTWRNGSIMIYPSQDMANVCKCANLQWKCPLVAGKALGRGELTVRLRPSSGISWVSAVSSFRSKSSKKAEG